MVPSFLLSIFVGTVSLGETRWYVCTPEHRPPTKYGVNPQGLLIADIRATDKIGWLGVYTEELTKPIKVALGVNYGILVTEIIQDSPADKGGIKQGDILLEIKGNTIEDFDVLKSVVESNPNIRVDIKIQRTREVKTMTITLGERPEEETYYREWSWVFPGEKFKEEMRELQREIKELQKNLHRLFKELGKEYEKSPKEPPKSSKKFKLKKFLKEFIPEEIDEI